MERRSLLEVAFKDVRPYAQEEPLERRRASVQVEDRGLRVLGGKCAILCSAAGCPGGRCAGFLGRLVRLEFRNASEHKALQVSDIRRRGSSGPLNLPKYAVEGFDFVAYRSEEHLPL